MSFFAGKVKRGGLRLRGSCTIEAVFVFPIILTILFGLIYYTLYLHDEIVLQTVADKYLQQVQSSKRMLDYEKKQGMGEAEGEKNSLEQEMENRLLAESMEWLSLTRLQETDMDLGVLTVKLSFVARRMIRLPLPDILLPEEENKLFKALIYDPAENLRGLGGILTNENGV